MLILIVSAGLLVADQYEYRPREQPREQNARNPVPNDIPGMNETNEIFRPHNDRPTRNHDRHFQEVPTPDGGLENQEGKAPDLLKPSH
ncbi:MAG: hypothetical protein Q8K75_00465 [Chlamydiales bacterium]|nr:hypothetical protein [Chlamydiales bacterium]